MKLPLTECIDRAAGLFRYCAVAFSGGKDSIVTLDLCMQRFDRVEAFFLYLVKGMEFQERLLRHYESRYRITVHRLPYYTLIPMYRSGVFRPVTTVMNQLRNLGQKEYEVYLRKKLGVEWFAYGYKCNDNFKRRGIIHGKGRRGIDLKFKRFYPVGEWSDKQIIYYCRQHNLPIEQRIGQHGFGGLETPSIVWLYQNHPADFERVAAKFPFIRAQLLRHELQTSKIRDDHNQA